MDNSNGLLRQQLLENVKKMCKYVETELVQCTMNFTYEYEHGFVYGHNSDKLLVIYSASSKNARIQINWYGTYIYFTDDGRVIESSSNTKADKTKSFLTDFIFCDGESMQKAIIVTQDNWERIKQEVQRHKEQEQRCWNFSV